MGKALRVNFIRPGKPVENSYADSFDGRLRDEYCTYKYISSTLSQSIIAVCTRAARSWI